jgi:hypothetical protein
MGRQGLKTVSKAIGKSLSIPNTTKRLAQLLT